MGQGRPKPLEAVCGDPDSPGASVVTFCPGRAGLPDKVFAASNRAQILPSGQKSTLLGVMTMFAYFGIVPRATPTR